MAVNPEDRYATCRALADDIERWIADEPVSARREPASARVARWARRHRTAVAAIALSLATAVVLLTLSNLLVRNAQHATARASHESMRSKVARWKPCNGPTPISTAPPGS